VTSPSVTGAAVTALSAGSTIRLASFPVTTGGAVVVFTALGAVKSITDSSGNNYVLVKGGLPNGLTIWLAIGVPGNPSLVVTITFSTTGECAAAAVGVSPVGGTAIDASGTGTTGSSSPASDTVVTTVPGDLVLMAVVIQDALTFGAVSPASIVVQAAQPTGNFAFAVLQLGTSGPNPYTPQAGFSGGSFSWGAISTAVEPYSGTPPPALQAAASGNPTSGNAPLTVAFSGSASGGTSPYSYAWNFGDGGVSNQQNPSHTYLSAGSFTAVLTVTDAASNRASARVQVSVFSPGIVAPTPGICAVLYVAALAAPVTVGLGAPVVGTPPANANGASNSCPAPVAPSS